MSSSHKTSRSGARWNGEPCEARRVRVIVADNERFPLYWARHLVGTERAAVEVTYNGSTFYIDDEGYDEREEVKAYLRERGHAGRDHVGSPGWGWAKVMAGGGPGHGHASLEIERVVGDA
jgi:hypothetical protein